MAPRETKHKAYAKFWGYKQTALWYVIVFSGAVNCKSLIVNIMYFKGSNVSLILLR